jgi:hypothetical protein
MSDEIEILGDDNEEETQKDLEDAIADEAEENPDFIEEPKTGDPGTGETVPIEEADTREIEMEEIAELVEETPPQATPESGQATDNVMSRLQEKMRIRAPEEIKKPMKSISFRDLENIILDLIRKYGGMERADLLQRIAVLELKLAQVGEKAQKMIEMERAKLDQRVAEKVIEWEKKCAVAEGLVADLEEKMLEAEKALESLERDLAAARAALTTDEQRTREILERRIAELEVRMVELEMGLDYFDLEEEIDAPAVREQVSGAKRKVDGRAETVAQIHLQKKIEQLTERLTSAHDNYDALKEKMFAGKGSISVVVDMIKAVKESESVEEQARDISQSMDA